MIFVTGPLFAGKEEYICGALGWSPEEFRKQAVRDVQELPLTGDLEDLADSLCRYAVVVATEVGGGVVPVDPEERERRERAGRLSCLLAQRAETVIRVQCGLPQLLKGKLPGPGPELPQEGEGL